MNLDVIDEIRSALDSPRTATRELLADTAAEYSEAVAAANRRLREVSQLLEQGLGGEALKFAEIKPPLLELVAVLDFPELDDWTGLLLNLALETPPKLQLNLAEQIDAAYGLMQPLEELLRRHRALAIAKAPLDKRIMILQQLLKRDPGNRGWLEDLENWQAARLKQIAEELTLASENKDLAKIQQFDRELNSSWCVLVPAPLIAMVQANLKAIEQTVARRELATVVLRLNDALTAHDEEQGRIARNEWEQSFEKANLSTIDELSQQADEALLWLVDCDQRNEKEVAYQSAIHQLEEAIDQNTKLDELNRRIYEVSRFERSFPPKLQTRAAEYQSSLVRTRKHKSVFLYTVVAALLVMAAVTIYQFVQQNIHQRQVASSVAELQGLLESKNYTAAELLYKKLPESISLDAQIASIWSKISTAVVVELQQHADFKTAFEKAVESGLDQPNYPEIDRAAQFAITGDQKADVSHFEAQVRQRQGELQTSRNEEFTEELAKFAEQLRSLIETTASTQSLEQIVLLTSEITTWKNSSQGKIGRYPIVSSEILAQVGPLLTRLEIRKKVVEAALIEQVAFQNITQGVGDPFKFANVLRAFVESMPDHYLAADFKSVIASYETENYFESYYSWASFFNQNQWAGVNTSSAATVLLSRGNDLIVKHPNNWLAAEFTKVKPYLESVASRTGPEGDTHVKELQQRLEGGFWTMAGMVVQKNQSAYYLPRAPVRKSTQRQAYYLALDYTEETRLFNEEHSEYFDPAKHTYLVASIREQLKSTEKTGWQPTFLNLVYEVVNEQSDESLFDPLIKIFLLKNIMKAGAAGDSFLAEQFNPLLLKIDGIDMTDVDWIAARLPDEEKNRYEVARRKASAIVQEIKSSIDDCGKKAGRALEAMGVQLEPSILNLRAVGWLCRDSAGRWSTLGLPDGLPNQDLYCLHPNNASGGVARLHKVATVDETGVRMVDSKEFLAGRLVFGNIEKTIAGTGK